MSKYFVNLAPGTRVYRYKKPMVDLTEIPSDTVCIQLYLQGFEHIGILPAAKKIFVGCTKDILEKLLEKKKNEGKSEEVAILKEILEIKSGKQKKQ